MPHVTVDLNESDPVGIEIRVLSENAAKVGNDLCPCGSGKKYKKCCGGAMVN